MPPTVVAGTIRELPLPKYRYDTVLAHVLSNHTDVLTAQNDIMKMRYNLRLAEVTAVPDVGAQVGVTNDETQPGPNRITGNFQVTVAIPVWNHNQGGIQQAKGALMRAIEEPHHARDDLTVRGRRLSPLRRKLQPFGDVPQRHPPDAGAGLSFGGAAALRG